MRSASVLIPRNARNESNGPGDAADGVLQEGELLAQLIVPSSPTTATPPIDIGMAIQVLRGRVHDEVEPELQRPLQVGRGERVVAHGR